MSCVDECLGRRQAPKPACVDLSKGAKLDTGKIRMDLLPVLPLLEVGRVYTMGAKKYADRNWEKGIAYSRIYGAMMRHLLAFWSGEDTHEVIEGDSSTECHHLASVVFGALALMEFERTHAELDDRPSS